MRQKKCRLGAFSSMTGSLTLNGSHLVNRLSETGGSHESRLFSSDPEWVEPVDALYGSTPLGSWVGRVGPLNPHIWRYAVIEG